MALLKTDVDRGTFLWGVATAILFWGVVLALYFTVDQMAALIVGIGGFVASGVLEYLTLRNDSGT